MRRVNDMGGVIQISILARISGNVNADEVIGQRITIKKMYSNTGEVLPFVSARAIKRAIRDALRERGHKIDEFRRGAGGELELADTGDPENLVDNDLFGYMVTEKGGAFSRQGPIAMSYFKALRDTPVKAEFGGRFPRENVKGANPVPFEVEVADFIGRLNVIIYDYIGKSSGSSEKKEDWEVSNEIKEKRLKDFLEVLLLPAYVLPRRTNSLNIPEYIGALITFSKKGPLPIYQYNEYDFEENVISIEALNRLRELKERFGDDVKFYYISYSGSIELPDFIEPVSVSQAIEKLIKLYFMK